MIRYDITGESKWEIYPDMYCILSYLDNTRMNLVDTYPPITSFNGEESLREGRREEIDDGDGWMDEWIDRWMPCPSTQHSFALAYLSAALSSFRCFYLL